MTAPALDFWFDFASTDSYPAAMRVRSLGCAAGVEVKFRPFLLGPSFKAQGWTRSPFNLFPAKGRNMWRDLERICAELSLPPMRRPEPFPQNSVLAARVALVGLADQWGEEFCRAVFCAEFADGRRIDDTETMGAILSKLDVEPSAVLAAAVSDDNKAGCGPRPKRRNGLACSARRASPPPTASCSGGTTGWNTRSPGRSRTARDRAASPGRRAPCTASLRAPSARRC
jgi:2-hydroxychromene-2-carboxylate isomerase